MTMFNKVTPVLFLFFVLFYSGTLEKVAVQQAEAFTTDACYDCRSGTCVFYPAGNPTMCDIVPPTVDIDASPLTVDYNTRTTVSWTIDDIDVNGCTAYGPWPEPRAYSGSVLSNELTSDSTFSIVCRNSAGQTLKEDAVTVKVRPSAPTLTAATPGSCGTKEVTLVWTNSTGETGYIAQIWNGSAWQNLGSSLPANTTSNVYTNLPENVLYAVRIVATNGAGGTASNELGVTTPSACPPPPSTPTLTVTKGSCGSGTLNASWEASSGATSYTLENWQPPSTWVTKATINPPTTSYSITGLTAGSPYSYRVKATNAGGSTYSNVVDTNAPSACASGSFTQAPTCEISVDGVGCSGTAIWTSSGTNFVKLTNCAGDQITNAPGGDASSGGVYVPYNTGCYKISLSDNTELARTTGSSWCISGSSWNGTKCAASAYSCTGTIPTNGGAYDAEESSSLTADTAWSYSGSDTATKCQYRCTSGTWDGSSCAVAVPTYSCTGTIPTNGGAYDAEESSSLTADTAWSYSGSDTATKCQYRCTSGTWDGSSCAVAALNGADLIAGGITDPSGNPVSATEGQSVRLYSLITNKGNQATGGSQGGAFQVAYQQATNINGANAQWMPDTYYMRITPLSAGLTTNIFGSAVFASAGPKYVRACADDGNLVPESDEGNNCGEWSAVYVYCAANYTLVAGVCVPTLVPPTLTVSRSPVVTGNSITLSWDTNNEDETSCTLTGKGVSDATLDAGGGDTNETGSVEVTITGRTTFTLTCSGLTAVKTVEIVPQSWET